MGTLPEIKRQLIEMMSEYNVSIRDVAEILDRSIPTVKNWRAANEINLPPVNELRLLKFELEARKAKQEKTPADANS